MSARTQASVMIAALLFCSARCVGKPAAHAPTQLAQSVPSPQSAAPRSSAFGAFRIGGVVVDASSGMPLAGAELRATHLTLGPGGGNAVAGSNAVVTSGDGRFVFEGLDPGRYQLTARRRGYPSMLFQQHEGVWSAVIVGPGLDTENLVFQLRASVIITGEVRDDAGDPVRGAQVMLYRQNLANGEKGVQVAGQKQTNDQGRYRFSGLQPGTYFVAVSTQPWYATAGVTRLRSRVAVNSSGQRVVITPDGQQEAPPDPDPLDVVYPITFLSGATDPARASSLNLLPGEQATADFNLYALPSVHLKVRVPANTEQGESFSFNVVETTMGNQQVSLPVRMSGVIDGVMDVAVPLGHLQLNITGFQNGKQTGHWLQDVEAARDSEVVVGGQSQSSSVGGIVKPPGTAAMPRQCVISVRHRETGESHGTQIGTDGNFEIPPQQMLRPGAYDVFLANCPLYHVERVSSPTPSVKFLGRSFELAQGESVRLIVELGAGLGRLDGVVLRDDKPASGVMVLMVPADGPVAASLIQRNQSNTDGSFFMTAIRPGKYTLVAVDNGWNIEWAKPEVLKPLLAHGETIQIEPNGQHKVTLRVQ